MDKTQHTPGPWRVGVGGPNGCPTVGTERGLLICMLGHSVHIPKQAETARDNAHLIAAAPDLLAVVQRTRDHAAFQLSQATAGSNEADAATLLLIAANEAIAKAEGSTNA